MTDDDKIPRFKLWEDDEAEEADPSWRGNLSSEWQGEEWISFDFAAGHIERRLGFSKGVAQRTLRELCARGDIRSIRYRARMSRDGIEGEDEPEFVRPSEWKNNELDLTGEDRLNETWVQIDVSEDDFEYWFAKQPKIKIDSKPKSRKSPRRDLAQDAIKSLWNGDPPKILPNPLIEKQVDTWITSHCKQNNIQKPQISRDTILRAAGRKASRALP
jgi:hypothetical protein